MGENVHRLDDTSGVQRVLYSNTRQLSFPRHDVDMVLQRINDTRFEEHSDNLTLDPIAAKQDRIEWIESRGPVFVVPPPISPSNDRCS